MYTRGNPRPAGGAYRILAADDDEMARTLIGTILRRNGFDPIFCNGGRQVIEALGRQRPDLLLLDLMMPEVSGLAVLQWVRRQAEFADLPVICVTAVDERATLDQLFSEGATDYVGKPIRPNELLTRIRLHLRILRQQQELREVAQEAVLLSERLLGRPLAHPEAFAEIITCNEKMKGVFHYLEAVAPSSRPVLVTGETGVGKELLARALHRLGKRRGEMVAVNVAGLDDALFSDTLFGHLKGSFTGASGPRQGMVEKAAGGTLFLDEIGDLSIPSQVKLLRLLQEHEYFPLGADQRQFTDARVVLATHCDLQARVADGSFREDLYYRLSTHHVRVPPLRERPDDIVPLLEHFLGLAAKDLRCAVALPPPDVLESLQRYSYPGNVRELESIAYDAASRQALHGGAPNEVWAPVLRSLAVPPGAANAPSLALPAGACLACPAAVAMTDQPFPTLAELTQQHIAQALERAGGKQAAAARLLGISRQALNKRLKSGQFPA